LEALKALPGVHMKQTIQQADHLRQHLAGDLWPLQKKILELDIASTRGDTLCDDLCSEGGVCVGSTAREPWDEHLQKDESQTMQVILETQELMERREGARWGEEEWGDRRADRSTRIREVMSAGGGIPKSTREEEPMAHELDTPLARGGGTERGGGGWGGTVEKKGIHSKLAVTQTLRVDLAQLTSHHEPERQEGREVRSLDSDQIIKRSAITLRRGDMAQLIINWDGSSNSVEMNRVGHQNLPSIWSESLLISSALISIEWREEIQRGVRNTPSLSSFQNVFLEDGDRLQSRVEAMGVEEHWLELTTSMFVIDMKIKFVTTSGPSCAILIADIGQLPMRGEEREWRSRWGSGWAWREWGKRIKAIEGVGKSVINGIAMELINLRWGRELFHSCPPSLRVLVVTRGKWIRQLRQPLSFSRGNLLKKVWSTDLSCSPLTAFDCRQFIQIRMEVKDIRIMVRTLSLAYAGDRPLPLKVLWIINI
jgi:hypothetical protein